MPLSHHRADDRSTEEDAGELSHSASDLRFFESLDQMVQDEPGLMREKAMIDPLKTIGIAQGEPFAPNDATIDLLTRAAPKGRAVLDFQYFAAFGPELAPGTYWALPVSAQLVEGMSDFFTVPDSFPADTPAEGCSIVFF
jgi:hypothetical protein